MTGASIMNAGEVIRTTVGSGMTAAKQNRTFDFAASVQEAAKYEDTGQKSSDRKMDSGREINQTPIENRFRHKKEAIQRDENDLQVMDREFDSDISGKDSSDEEITVKELDELIGAILEAMNVITQVCEVSLEQLQDGMEEMKMSPVALLNQNCATPLVMNLKQLGEADVLTEEDMGNLVLELKQKLQEITEGLSDNLQVTPENVSVNAILDRLAQPEDMGSITEVQNTDSQEMILGKDVLRSLLNSETGSSKLQKAFENPVIASETQNAALSQLQTEPVTEEGASNASTDITAGKAVQTGLAELKTDPDTNESQFGNDSNDRSNHSETRPKQTDYSEAQSIQAFSQTSETSDTVGIQSHAFTETTREIADQIIKFIKVTIKPGITEAQMNLNPENLGRIQVHIETGENGVTARFLTQNEQVKSAIEAQVSVLKETLESQGVKIDAVEVTVASHQFEQNSRQEANRSDKDEKGHTLRRIKLDADTEEPEAETITEEDRIAESILRANGNSIDFKA